MKIAKVIPLFKKHDSSLLSSYRPILLLPALSEVFKKILWNQITEYFNLNYLFYEAQYGFRKNHSTELEALHLTDNITQRIKKENTPIAIYLDLSKAFDTINHSILLDKLKYYGLQSNALGLIKKYLSYRRQEIINN